jgi:hypothetical protein
MRDLLLTYLTGVAGGGIAALMLTRPFSLKRKLKAAQADVAAWREGYEAEVRDRLAGIDAIHAWRRLATAASHRVDFLRGLLNSAHYRNPETGQLSPLGQFPEEIKQ